MGYTKDAIKGISWLSGFRILTRFVAFGKTAVLARLLSPAQFGLFSISSFVLSFIEILAETGINTFLIQKKSDADTYINTAWIVSIVRGFLIGLFIIFLAPVISRFFNAPDSYALLVLTGFVPIIRGFINPSIIKLVANLEFHKEFSYRTFLFLIESLVTIALASLLKNPSAIVWGLLVGAVLEVVISFFIVRPIPLFQFKPKLFREIIQKGKWLTVAGIFNYLYHHGDDMVVGKTLGTTQLGIYDMAYKISMLPITEIGDVVTRVTFPVYVKIVDDKKRLARAFLRTFFATSAIVIPVGLLFFFFPNQLINLFLGEKWLGAVDVLRVLAIFGVIRAISFSTSALFLSYERQDILTVIAFVSFLGMGITIFPLISQYGIVGAGYAALIGTLVALPVIVFYLIKLFR